MVKMNFIWTVRPHSWMHFYLPQLPQSRLIIELMIDELKDQIDAIERDIKNLKKMVGRVAKAIQKLYKLVEANIADI